MKKDRKDNLLNKYYKGDSTQEEESILKNLVLNEETDSPEMDAFSFYQSEAEIPDGLEDGIFEAIQNKEKRKKTIIRSLAGFTSIAASIIIILGIYIDSRNKKMQELENSFFVMEQAMYKVSETIQPHEQEEMLVLWVDDEMEIIIN